LKYQSSHIVQDDEGGSERVAFCKLIYSARGIVMPNSKGSPKELKLKH